MAALLAVLRQEVEVISGNAERAREAWRPDSDERADDVGEVEFSLRLGGVDRPSAFLRRIDGSCPHPAETAVEPEGIEDVAGSPDLVAPVHEFLEAADRSDPPGRLPG
jgi:hypothetical protein